MNNALLIGVLILGGLSLGWALHRRSVRQMKPILRRLAAEKNGIIEPPSPFLMPKLRFLRAGTEVEVSSASTGIDGESSRYTYALFTGLDLKSFEFRILPQSLQSIGDKWIGLKKPMSTRANEFDKLLVIYTNNEQLMEAVLSDRIQADLLSWAKQKPMNRISDIRNYDGNLLFAVTGDLKSYEEYKLLLDTACRFYDAVTGTVSMSKKS
ncbi:MAG: hypothetical protein V7731_15490 [Amphritea sp.]